MTCRNCITNDETGKRSPAANCSRVKQTTLSASPIVEKASSFDNSKLISSGTQQKDLNPSTDIEVTRLLVVGYSQLDLLLRPT